MNMTHWRGWLVAGAIFLLGIAVGGGLVAWAGARSLRHALQAPTTARGAADRAAERIGADLTETLRLTPEESTRVQAILNQSASNMKAVRAQATGQVAAELRASTASIAATLPPGKRMAFYRVIARRFERLGFPPPQPDPSR
jgi:hypothetical protein